MKQNKEISIKKADFIENISEWLEALRLDEKSQNTIRHYQNGIETFLEYLEKEQIEEISKDTTLNYKNYLNDLKQEGKYKVTTINAKILTLNVFLKYLGLEEAMKVHKYKVQSGEYFKECLTDTDYKKLLDYAYITRRDRNNYRNYMIMRVLGETGIRIAELEAFTVDNLKNMKHKIKVTNKGKERSVYIPESLKLELLKYAEENNIENNIFHGFKKIELDGKKTFVKDESKMIDRSVFWRSLKSLAKKAGVNPDLVSAHLFRHRFGLQYLKSNGNNMQALINLSRILGHSSLDTTRAYLNVSDEELEASINGIYD